jgi:Ca2+-binding RTX toxin-like protein
LVISSVTSYFLGSNVEDLFLASAAVLGNGNSLANNIVGNNLANSLLGDGGADVLTGGGGNDTLSGGGALDVFVFTPDFGADRVSDFDYNPTGGQDLLDLTAFGITAMTFASRVSLTDLGSDIVVTVDSNATQTIRLANAQSLSNITSQDFLL